MKLTKITIHNFKSISDLTIYPSVFTAITGLNGTGKSNVIDAVTFILNFNNKEMRINKLTDLIKTGETTCYVELTFQVSRNLYEQAFLKDSTNKTGDYTRNMGFKNDFINNDSTINSKIQNDDSKAEESPNDDFIKNDVLKNDLKSKKHLDNTKITIIVKKEIKDGIARTFLNNSAITQNRLNLLLQYFQLLIVRQGTITKIVNKGISTFLYESIGLDPSYLKSKLLLLEQKELKLIRLKNEKLKMIQPYFNHVIEMKNKIKQELQIKKNNEKLIKEKNILKIILKKYEEIKQKVIKYELLTLNQLIEKDDQFIQVTEKKVKIMECKEELQTLEKEEIKICSTHGGNNERSSEWSERSSEKCEKLSEKRSEKRSENNQSEKRSEKLSENELYDFSVDCQKCKEQKLIQLKETLDKNRSASLTEIEKLIFDIQIKESKQSVLQLDQQARDILQLISENVHSFTKDSQNSVVTKDSQNSVVTKDSQNSVVTKDSQNSVVTKDSQNSVVTKDSQNSVATKDSHNSVATKNINIQHKTPLNDSHIFKIVECVRKLVLENTTFNTLNILPKDHKLHNLDILFTYGRVYENFKIDQLYEKAIDAILLNKRNYIITETGYLTGKGTFIPLDRISYTNNVKCSTADKFIKYNIILEKAFKYLLNGYHIVLNENDIQKHKINKELCVTLDGTVIDYRGTMTGGTLNLRYECSKKETFDSIQKVLDVLEENLNKICDKNITNEDESNDLGLKESESKGFKTNEDESKDSDTRNESGSKCFKTNESGSKCFKTNESGSNDSDTRNENESKGLKKSLMELKDLIARLISVSVRFSTVEGQKNNSLTINELKDFMNHCKSLPDMIDNLNDMILTYNKEQQRASTTINKLRKLIDQYDVIQTAIQNTSKNTSQTKNNLSLAELRSVLLDRKSQVLTYENEISQAQIMIDQCKKLFEKQLVIKNKKLELEDFIKSNVIKEQETMDFEKRKEIKRRILQLSSLQTDEEIIHEDLGSMTEIENIFDGLENTTTYDQLKEEARPVVLDLIDSFSSVESSDKNGALPHDNTQFDKSSYKNCGSDIVTTQFDKSSGKNGASNTKKLKRDTILPPDTLLKDSIQKINEQIQSTNNNETGQTEQRQHIIEVYEKNEQDLQLLFSRIEQLEKDKLVLNKNLNFLEKELTTKMDSLINFINKNVKNNWFINNIRLQLSKIGDLLITDSNNNPISINELSGGQKSLMAVSVMFTAVQYYDLHNIRISGDEIQASKTGEGTTSKDEKCWDTPLSEEKNTDTASMATHRESQGGVLCLFDEIDAALDPNQTERIASFLKTRGCQTLVISLKEGFYEQAERVYEIYRQGTGAKAQRVK